MMNHETDPGKFESFPADTFSIDPEGQVHSKNQLPTNKHSMTIQIPVRNILIQPRFAFLTEILMDNRINNKRSILKFYSIVQNSWHTNQIYHLQSVNSLFQVFLDDFFI